MDYEWFLARASAASQARLRAQEQLGRKEQSCQQETGPRAGSSDSGSTSVCVLGYDGKKDGDVVWFPPSDVQSIVTGKLCKG